MTFAKWMDHLDEVCLTDLDMTIHDLPDLALRQAYRRGTSPEAFTGAHTLALFAANQPDVTTAPAERLTARTTALSG